MKRSTVPPVGANTNPVDKGGLCLLSLDGGGVRGLSTLLILERIMGEVNRLRQEKGLPSRKPCEVFDMIGGTSTGGLIAIMLGRLGMEVKECIKVYKDLMPSVFGTKTRLHFSAPTTVNAQYDSKKIKTEIEKVLREKGFDENSEFYDEKERRCRVFVCCVSKDNMDARRIRSYNQELHDKIPATISQAALATSAATTFFDPVVIGPCQYIDGALRNNNPVIEVEAEAEHLWSSDQVELKSLVKCFLTIGTGTPAKEEISYNWLKLPLNIKSLVTDTEATRKISEERWCRLLNERYFRFDVAQGLQNVCLDDYKKLGTIVEATNGYMDEGDQQNKLQACTENLMNKELQGTPLDFHETVSAHTLHVRQGSYDSKDFRDCRTVLRVTDVEKDRNDLKNATGARVPGTLEWITTDKGYQDWQSSGPDALWITAGPGRGKTMLSLFILENLEYHISTPGTLPYSIVQEEHGKKADLYYFFCSSQEGSRRGAVAVFRSLIHQIVSKHEDLMKSVLDYLGNNRPIHADNELDNEIEKQQRNQEKELETQPKIKSTIFQNMMKQQGTQPESSSTKSANTPERDSPKSRQLELLDVSELSFILRKLIRELAVDKAYFLLDGVDECVKEEQESLTSTMLKLLDVKPGKFKLLVVSQPIGGMGTTPTIRLEETEQTKGDIEKFVSKSVEQLANIDGFKYFQQEVEQTLLKRAEGTFLWVSLVMREIEKKRTCTDIAEILAAVQSPPGLNNKYSHMLKQIDPAHQRKVFKILRWVTAAIRPLTLQELSEVIKDPSSNLMPPEQAVRDGVTSSEGLLKIQGDEVTFTHSSAKMFLLCDKTSNGVQGGIPVALEELHYELAQSCYEDILHSGFSRSEIKVSDLSDKEERKMLKYAIRYWMEHVKASDWAEKNFDPEFFRRDSKLRKNWWTAYLEDSQNDEPKNFNVASLLHLAAYFGIVTWVKRAFDGKAWLAKKGTILMELDYYYRTPLHIAVEQGHGPVVSLLLDHGVNIEFREASLFATPLHLAARNGHKAICEILLDRKARINPRNRFDSTPLTEAARGGHLEVVKLLVQRGADIDGSIDKKRRSLYRHLENVPGYTKRVLGKIEGLAYAERSTPVIEAARQNHPDIIRHLVRHGANIEAKTLDGSNALHIAAYHGQMKSMEVLVELRANIEKKDDSSHTALFIASWQKHADAVRWLLDQGADSDPTTSWGFTPLLVASKHGYLEPMGILLEAHANIEHRDEKGFTSLAVAAKFGQVAAVKLLIDYNAKINAQDHSGNVALTHAIQDNLTDEHVETVQLLLKHDANVNHQNQDGLTPLMKAAELSNGDAASILEHMLEKGAALDARDNEGRTALMHAFKGGSNKTRELLLNKGADIEAQDDLGDTALIIAAGYSNPEAVDFLLEHGADIEVRDRYGFTPLIKAAKCGLDDTVNLLLDRGAQIAAVDKEDKAAIDHAATRERGNIIKLLKSRGASRHNLSVIEHAAATLSNVMCWTVEACREWERGWEIAELKKVGKSASDEGSDDAGAKKPNEQEVTREMDKSSDVDSESTNVKLVDGGPSVGDGAPTNCSTVT